jgi:hypothetical protein
VNILIEIFVSGCLIVGTIAAELMALALYGLLCLIETTTRKEASTHSDSSTLFRKCKPFKWLRVSGKFIPKWQKVLMMISSICLSGYINVGLLHEHFSWKNYGTPSLAGEICSFAIGGLLFGIPTGLIMISIGNLSLRLRRKLEQHLESA